MASIFLIYVPGVIWLGLWLTAAGKAASLAGLLAMGVVPFIIGDALKILAAAALTQALTPKQAYNGEANGPDWSRWRLP